tara:strand:- start:19 stop:600 length:582 start_codon:yes stop_codon:yes gene_type:complete
MEGENEKIYIIRKTFFTSTCNPISFFRFELPKEFIMKKLFLIVLPLFISVGFGQKIISDIEKRWDNLNPRGIMYFKKIGNKIEKYKRERYSPNGQKLSEEYYENGKLNGKVKNWSEDGISFAEGLQIDGLRNGKFNGWYKIGKKHFEIMYKNGDKDGLETWWHENGQKKKEIINKDDVEISKKEWNEDGSVKE